MCPCTVPVADLPATRSLGSVLRTRKTDGLSRLGRGTKRHIVFILSEPPLQSQYAVQLCDTGSAYVTVSAIGGGWGGGGGGAGCVRACVCACARVCMCVFCTPVHPYIRL